MERSTIIQIYTLFLLLAIPCINKAASTEPKESGEKSTPQTPRKQGRRIINPRTDLTERMDKEFDDLIDNEIGMDINNSPVNAIETEIFTTTFQLAVKYNKQLFFGFFMLGTLLAVIFPQQTKSVILDTTSKVKRIIHQCTAFFTNVKRKLRITANHLLFF